MAKTALDLVWETPADWATVAISDFNLFLQEHANMERKASAMALSFISKYPDQTEIIDELIEVAQEELEHFRDVYKLMQERGVPLKREEPDSYVNQLIESCRHGREDRFIDRLCVASILECRGAERFKLVSNALEDEGLKKFYRDLWACEAKHGNVFVEMALKIYPEDKVYPRLSELVHIESEICSQLPWRPSLH